MSKIKMLSNNSANVQPTNNYKKRKIGNRIRLKTPKKKLGLNQDFCTQGTKRGREVEN